MFKLERLRLEITTSNQTQKKELYGFDIPFENGLNIIAGQNSQGKTTINSCIYYILGMEELLGGQGSKWLDKALKEEFNTLIDNKRHFVFSSKVYAQISNSSNNVVTLQRFIKHPSDKKKNDIVTIFESPITSIRDTTTSNFPLFIRGKNNNSTQFGFYSWFASFMDLRLPIVANTNTAGESPLYLQLVFPALFIEQTKGWSDFFATTPYFGVTKVREKVVEFILNLNELVISIQRDKIDSKIKALTEEWKLTISKLELLVAEYQGILRNKPKEITADKTDLTSTLYIKETVTSDEIIISDLIKHYGKELKDLQNKPLSKVGDKKAEVRIRLENKQKEHNEFHEQFSEFETKFNIQKRQIRTLKSRQKQILKELEDQQGIKRIFDEALMPEEIYSTCPTCSQEVSTDLISQNNVTISKLTIEENVSYLNNQKKMIANSLGSLEKIIQEKNQIHIYYRKKQRYLEEEIKYIFNELVADDKAYSDTEALKRVRTETKIRDYKFLHENFVKNMDLLKHISDNYQDALKEKENLKEGSKDDKQVLNQFETIFKEHLFDFEYNSNIRKDICIQPSFPFKYFPVFKSSYGNSQPQSIRVNSSASDFVRSIWAYTLSLLETGKNHPGIVLFDEPGQHRADTNSLQKLFRACARIKNKQIIIFTSIDKQINGNETINLAKFLEEIESECNIYAIDSSEKCIALLRNP